MRHVAGARDDWQCHVTVASSLWPAASVESAFAWLHGNMRASLVGGMTCGRQRVSDKSALQELQECQARVSHKSVPQKRLLQECPARVSHKSVKHAMFRHLFSSACVRSGSWTPSCFKPSGDESAVV